MAIGISRKEIFRAKLSVLLNYTSMGLTRFYRKIFRNSSCSAAMKIQCSDKNLHETI